MKFPSYRFLTAKARLLKEELAAANVKLRERDTSYVIAVVIAAAVVDVVVVVVAVVVVVVVVVSWML